ncbi:endonuclease domain-containing protein [Comamonas sediminis]|uniref:endonuclease domain-containing protein n=1 Tax=Comamonas sediminis TaxID=1783360 RepID=UPI003D2C7CB3
MHNNALLSNPLSRKREKAGVRADVRLQQARALRQSPTTAEQVLWRHLRNRQLAGTKFRRQHPLSPYILDFVCLAQGLVVEVDGGQHADLQAQGYDRQRTVWLRQQGLRVLRFWKHEVVQQTNEVLAHVLQALTPAFSRLREREVNTEDE